MTMEEEQEQEGRRSILRNFLSHSIRVKRDKLYITINPTTALHRKNISIQRTGS
jgi:hypothetical protein